MFSVDDDRNTCQTRSDETLEECAPGVGVHYVRPLAPEQPIHVPHDLRIVAVAPSQLEKRHVRLEK